MNLDRRLLNEARLVKYALGMAVAAGFLAGLATVWQAMQVSGIVARVFLEGQGLAQVMPLMWGLLAAVIARAGMVYLSDRFAGRAARAVKAHLREQLVDRLFALGAGFTQGERSGELINTATQGIEALDAYFRQYLPQLAMAGLLPLAYLTLVLPRDPLSALVLLLTGPLIPLFMFLIGSNAQRLTGRQWTAMSRMSAYLMDTLQGMLTLKALGRSREQEDRIARISDQYRQTTMRVLRVTFLSSLALELLGTIGTAIIAVQIGLRLLYGRVGFEEAFFVLLLAPDFYQPLRALGLRFHASMAGVSAARRIFAILEQPLPAAGLAGEQHPVPSLRRPFTITLENVHVTYPGRAQPALDGVDLRISSGQTTALVGESGAGKSTVAGLLLRFVTPDRGCVRVNGVDLASVPVEDWRAQIAWVPQQPYLLHGTLADNLRLARPSASDQDLRRAAEQAQLLEWIDGLPLGLDTPVGEGGALISGGQAQRLVLARAFLRDAPLLILDEPTAHLDLEQERVLQAALAQLCSGRTVLVIAHRLATVRGADQIVVLSRGRVAEIGDHTRLYSRGGLYTRLLDAYQGGGA